LSQKADLIMSFINKFRDSILKDENAPFIIGLLAGMVMLPVEYFVFSHLRLWPSENARLLLGIYIAGYVNGEGNYAYATIAGGVAGILIAETIISITCIFLNF
jgi:hypothetical protein